MGALHDPDPAELETLARALQRGGDEALADWYRREHPEVHRLCFGFLAEANEAEDAAQDAMLHLADRIRSWDSRRDYKPWRNTLVLNLCRDRLRRNATRLGFERVAAEQGLPDRMPDPAREAQREEVREALARTLRELPPREREAFVLRDLEGGSTREVAEAMDVTEGAVRTLTTLARRRVRGLLEQRLPGLTPETGGRA